MDDLTHDEHGNLHARLLDVVPVRSGTANACLLKGDNRPSSSAASSRPPSNRSAVRQRPAGRAARGRRGPGRFHVVELGTQVVDEVRCQPSRTSAAPRAQGRPAGQDPRPANAEDENTSPTRRAPCLQAVDPHWGPHHRLARLTAAALDIPSRRPAEGRRIAEHVIASFRDCPIPEVTRLGRTLKRWRPHVLARCDSHRTSNGGSEPVDCGSCSPPQEPAPTDEPVLA